MEWLNRNFTLPRAQHAQLICQRAPAHLRLYSRFYRRSEAGRSCAENVEAKAGRVFDTRGDYSPPIGTSFSFKLLAYMRISWISPGGKGPM